MSRPPVGANRWAQFNAFMDGGAKEAGLSKSASLLWLYLFRHADERGNVKNVSFKRIAIDTPLAKRTITDAIGELHSSGLLQVLQEGRENGSPAEYRIRPRNPSGKPAKPRRRRAKVAEPVADSAIDL